MATKQAKKASSSANIVEQAIQELAFVPKVSYSETVKAALENYRKAATAARNTADSIISALDSTGRSGEEEKAETEKKIHASFEELRKEIEMIRGSEVAAKGPQKLVEKLGKPHEAYLKKIEAQMDKAEKAITGGNFREARKSMLEIQKKMKSLESVIKVQESISAANGPKELVERMDKVLEYIEKGEGKRADMLLKAGQRFGQLSGTFMSRGAEPVFKKFMELTEKLADDSKKLDAKDLEKLRASSGKITRDITSIAIVRRNAARQAFEYKRHSMSKMLAMRMPGVLKKRIDEIIKDTDKTIEKLSSGKLADISDIELRNLSMRILGAEKIISTVMDKGIPLHARRAMGTVYTAALDLLASGKVLSARLLIFSADQIKKSPWNDKKSVNFRSKLIHFARKLINGSQKEKKSAKKGILKELGSLLGGLLRKNGKEIEGEAEETMEEFASSLDENSDLETLMNASEVFDASSKIKGRISGSNKKNRKRASSVFSRGLRRLTKGDKEVAIMLFNLAAGHASPFATEEDREELESIAEILEKDPEKLGLAKQYMDLFNRAADLRSKPKKMWFSKSGRAVLEKLAAELDGYRRNIAKHGSIIEDQEVAKTTKEIEERIKLDPDFKKAIEVQIRKVKKEGETTEQATKRVINGLAVGSLLSQEQVKLTELWSISDSVEKLITRRTSSVYRGEITGMLGKAVDAAINGEVDDAAIFRKAAHSYSDLKTKKDRDAVVKICNEAAKAERQPGVRRFSDRQLRELEVYSLKSQFSITKRSEIRNSRAYFDMALLAARGKNPDEFKAILDLACAHADMASVPESKLSEEEKKQLQANMKEITGLLGDYNKIGTRRLIDIADGVWKPKAELVTSTVAKALIEGRTIIEALGHDESVKKALVEKLGKEPSAEELKNAEIENGITKFKELSSRIDVISRQTVDFKFSVRCNGLTNEGQGRKEKARERRYRREAGSLKRDAKRANARGDETLSKYLAQEAERVDRKFVHESVKDAREIYKKGQAAITKAMEFGAELENAESISAKQAMKRIQELTSIEKPQLEKLAKKGDKYIKSVYVKLLKQLGQQYAKQGRILINDANRVLDGVETYDKSMNLYTRQRYSGRFEIVAGIKVLRAIAKGHDVDLLGEPVLKDEKPVLLSKEKRKLLRVHAHGAIAVGIMAGKVQEQIQQSVRRGVRWANIAIRDRNVAQAKALITRMIDSTQSNGQYILTESERKEFRTKLDAALKVKDHGKKAKELQAAYASISTRYQKAYEEVAEEKGVNDVVGFGAIFPAVPPGEKATEKPSLFKPPEKLYNAEEHYGNYKKTVGLFYGEYIDAGYRSGRVASFLIGSQGVAARSWVDDRILRIDRLHAIPHKLGPIVSLFHPGSMDKKQIVIPTDEMFQTSLREEERLTLEAIEQLPPKERERFQKRLRKAKTGIERIQIGLDLNQITEINGRKITDAKGNEIGLVEAVRQGSIAQYSLDGFQQRIQKLEERAKSGDIKGAEEGLLEVQKDMETSYAAQQRDTERFGFRHAQYRLEDEYRATGYTNQRFYEQGFSGESKRMTGEREDRNHIIRKLVGDIDKSYERSIKRLGGAAEKSLAARDEISGKKTVLRTTTEFGNALVRNIPKKLRRKYSILIENFEKAAVNPKSEEAAKACRLLYSALIRRSGDFDAVMKTAKSDKELTPMLSQMEADSNSYDVRKGDRGERVARAVAEELIRGAQEDLQFADNAQRTRNDVASQLHWEIMRGPPLMGEEAIEKTYHAHRKHAIMGLEFAKALLRENTAVLADEIIMGNATIEAEATYYKGKEKREWHGNKRLMLGSDRRTFKYKFQAADRIRDLIYWRRMERSSYADSDAMDKARNQEAADAEKLADAFFLNVLHLRVNRAEYPRHPSAEDVYLDQSTDRSFIFTIPPEEMSELAPIGSIYDLGGEGRLSGGALVTDIDEKTGELAFVRGGVGKDYSIVEDPPDNKEEAKMRGKTYAQIRQILAKRDGAVFSIDSSWVGTETEKLYERTGERVDHAYVALKAAIKGRNEDAMYEFESSVPFDMETGEDYDDETAKAIQDMKDWASYERSTYMLAEITGIGLTAVFAPEALPIVLPLFAAKGMYEAYELRLQEGEWTGKSGFMMGISLASGVLPVLGAAVGTGGRIASVATAEMVGAEARSIASTTVKTIVKRGAVAEFLIGGSEMGAAQRAIHISGTALMFGGTGQFLVNLPGMMEAIERGDMTLLEGALQSWSGLIQNVAGAKYSHYAVKSYRSRTNIPRWVEITAGLALGNPVSRAPFSRASRDYAAIQKHMTAMPPKERAAYTRYIEKHGIVLNPARERAILRQFNKARQKGMSFESFVRSNNELRIAAYEAIRQRYEDGTVQAADLTKDQLTFVKTRSKGKPEGEALESAQKVVDLSDTFAKKQIENLKLTEADQLAKFGEKLLSKDETVRQEARKKLELLGDHPAAKVIREMIADKDFAKAVESGDQVGIMRFRKNRAQQYADRIKGPKTEAAEGVMKATGTDGKPVKIIGQKVEAPKGGEGRPEIVAMAGGRKKGQGTETPPPEVGDVSTRSSGESEVTTRPKTVETPTPKKALETPVKPLISGLKRKGIKYKSTRKVGGVEYHKLKVSEGNKSYEIEIPWTVPENIPVDKRAEYIGAVVEEKVLVAKTEMESNRLKKVFDKHSKGKPPQDQIDAHAMKYIEEQLIRQPQDHLAQALKENRIKLAEYEARMKKVDELVERYKKKEITMVEYRRDASEHVGSDLKSGEIFTDAAKLRLLCDSEFIPSDIKKVDPSTLTKHEQKMAKLIWEFPKAFLPDQNGIYVEGNFIQTGAPMNFGSETAIPIFITAKGGKRSFVLAYKSKSQACWRRFAGLSTLLGTYYKGSGFRAEKPYAEHNQNPDWRIQKQLDKVAREKTHIDIVRFEKVKREYVGLEEFGITGDTIAIHLIEDNYQHEMGLNTTRIDMTLDGNKPSKVVDHWISSDDTYGTHATVVVESKDGNYQYVLAVTEDGLFVKYAQDTRSGGINEVGSPKKAAIFKDEKLYAPIVEYNDTKHVSAAERKRFMGKETVQGMRGSRRIKVLIGWHSVPESPFYGVDMIFADLYPKLRSGRLKDAIASIKNIKTGHIPVSLKGKRTDIVDIRSILGIDDGRLATLEAAYKEFLEGRLNANFESGRRVMKEYGISDRELFLFEEIKKAYDKADGIIDAKTNLEKQHADLRLMAFTWTRDKAQEHFNSYKPQYQTEEAHSQALISTSYENMRLQIDVLARKYDANEQFSNPYGDVYTMQRFRMQQILRKNPKMNKKLAALQAIREVNSVSQYHRVWEDYTNMPSSGVIPNAMGRVVLLLSKAAKGGDLRKLTNTQVYEAGLKIVLEMNQENLALPFSPEIRKAARMHEVAIKGKAEGKVIALKTLRAQAAEDVDAALIFTAYLNEISSPQHDGKTSGSKRGRPIAEMELGRLKGDNKKQDNYVLAMQYVDQLRKQGKDPKDFAKQVKLGGIGQ